MKTILYLSLLPFCAFAQTLGPTKPMRPLGVPADAKHFNGRWYKVYLETKSWHAAREKCKALGGQLATVPDAETWNFVKELTPAFVWLGATDEAKEGVWKWVDGTDMKFKAWNRPEPNNIGGIEHYVATFKTGGWNDLPDAGKHERDREQSVVGFICEWKSKRR